MKVRVYFNLHLRCWSVQLRCPGSDLDGIVIGHAAHVELREVWPKVYKAGREKVRAEKRKNVHAFMEGTLVAVEQLSIPKRLKNLLDSDPQGENPLFDTVRSCVEEMKRAEGRPMTRAIDIDAVGKVTYNPYSHDHFVWDDDGEQFVKSPTVVMMQTGVYAQRPPAARYVCGTCGSDEVELLYPAWVTPNRDGEPHQVDWDAEPLSTYCVRCQDNTAVRDNTTGEVIKGRWH